jgi:purine-nucleoside phosphorylase
MPPGGGIGARSPEATCGTYSIVGAAWTTDAPFRETTEAIEWARSKDAIAVEMEAAALYAFARAADVAGPLSCPGYELPGPDQ